MVIFHSSDNFYLLVQTDTKYFVRMATCLQVNLWCGSSWKASASLTRSLESTAKR